MVHIQNSEHQALSQLAATLVKTNDSVLYVCEEKLHLYSL